VTKTLMLIHFVIIAPQTTIDWLEEFMSDYSLLKSCQLFREGEMVDPQAAAHAEVIRRYAVFLERFSREALRRKSPLCKLCRIKEGSDNLGELDNDELLDSLSTSQMIFETCLDTFMDENHIRGTFGFCELTAGCLRQVYRQGLAIYGVINISMNGCIERLETYNDEDNQRLREAYDLFIGNTKRLMMLCSFVKTVPGFHAQVIPVLEVPPTSLKAPDVAPIRTAVMQTRSKESGVSKLDSQVETQRSETGIQSNLLD